ncbi:MAG: hypothetical protein IT198_13075 [Acidimicrobiia bacterium]|nr:hypothetical protein [Acidimicrobiia bacterium]
MTDADEHTDADSATQPGFRVVRGGRPTDEEAAALAVTVELVVREAEAAGSRVLPAADEWALQGRLHALGWQPLLQRWPGEPHGRSWRRVLD